MTTHIDRVVTDITVEPEPESKTQAKEPRWDGAERLARMLQRSKVLELRTRAEGFDD